jgi:two-component system, response regulator PdtaR
MKAEKRTKPRVLIVEDEAVIALDIKLSLESAGFAASGIAVSGEDSIRQAASLRPDLILMDISLKGAMNGILAAHEIFRLYRIPVIYLTAYTDPKTVAGTSPFACLFKPYDDGELKTTIWNSIGGLPGALPA